MFSELRECKQLIILKMFGYLLVQFYIT